MDILVEILLEVYMELMLLIVPEKNITKKHLILAKIFAIAVLFGIIALFVWGIVLIADYRNLWGIAPITIASVLSLFQIIAGIVFYKKNH